MLVELPSGNRNSRVDVELHEKNYSANELEALAIVKGIKHCRTYLEGNQFIIIQTDHNPLTHLANFKDNHRWMARWPLSLQHYYRLSNHHKNFYEGDHTVVCGFLSFF